MLDMPLLDGPGSRRNSISPKIFVLSLLLFSHHLIYKEQSCRYPKKQLNILTRTIYPQLQYLSPVTIRPSSVANPRRRALTRSIQGQWDTSSTSSASPATSASPHHHRV